MSIHPAVISVAEKLREAISQTGGNAYVVPPLDVDPQQWMALSAVEHSEADSSILLMPEGGGLLPDETTQSAILRRFDNSQSWIIAHFSTDTAIALDDILQVQWIRSPKLFICPVDETGILVAMRFKIGERDDHPAVTLNVMVSEGIADMDAELLLKDARDCVFEVRVREGALLPDRRRLADLLNIKTKIAKRGIRITELGGNAEIETIKAEDAQTQGLTGCCYYVPSLRRAVLSLEGVDCAPANIIVRIEPVGEQLRADYVAAIINDLDPAMRSRQPENFLATAAHMLVVMVPLENQAAAAQFKAANESCHRLFRESLGDLYGKNPVAQLAEPAGKLFDAGVRCASIAEAGDPDGARSLPYPMACAFQAYQCASSNDEKFEKAFKMVDAFIEFHSLCALSVAYTNFMHDAADRIAATYNNTERMDLGTWCYHYREAVELYNRRRTSPTADDLAILTGALGVASLYAIDILFSQKVVKLFDQLRNLRNTRMAHGPTWGAEEKSRSREDAAQAIYQYLEAAAPLWGHVRLGYCSKVEKLSARVFSTFVERCGHARYGRSGVSFRTPDDRASPGTLVLYLANEEDGFVGLLPFYCVKQIAPSLHIIYHLSRTEKNHFYFNSYAGLDGGLKAQEEIKASDDRIASLVGLLANNKAKEPFSGRARSAD